jgi:ADP-heptose:LPS heptosyltransferase
MGEGWGGGRDRAQWPQTLPPPPEARLRIAIHPAAGTDIKHWPPAHFATLIEQIAQTTDAAFILLGTQADAPIAEAITAALNPAIRLTSAVGLTDLPMLARVIAACDLLIGNDSGPHHLAASLGVPTLGLHSGVVDANEWSPRGPEAVALRRRMRCSPCYLAERNDCPRSVVCLNESTPGQALTMVHMLVTDR